MSPHDNLRERIASILDMSPDDVSAATPLNQSRLRSSAGRVILVSAVKACTGKIIDTSRVSTFGELLAVVDGKTVLPTEVESNPAAPFPEPFATDGSSGGMPAIGIDIEHVGAMPSTDDYWDDAFYRDQFSAEEIAYCVTLEEPRIHFAARWCAKEALKKAHADYMTLAFNEIQIVRGSQGKPSLQVRPNGTETWRDIPASVSLSHTQDVAVAVVALAMMMPQIGKTERSQPSKEQPETRANRAPLPQNKSLLKRLFSRSR